jgi:glycosyltransferase involved in cell wall biosynthesis
MSSEGDRRGSLVYAAFDRFPAPKGAATHIRAFVDALSRQFATVDLVTVAAPHEATSAVASSGWGGARPPEVSSRTDALPCFSAPNTAFTTSSTFSSHVRHTPLPAFGETLVERVLHFRAQLRSFWGDRRPDVVHVRSIFEGYPIARDKRRWCDRLVFEVNGLPSIELKYHYPRVADDRELMKKLRAQEQCCLEAADLVLTVSRVNAAYLRSRGVPRAKLRVIPNGVDPRLFFYQPPRPWGDREIRLLYSGTLSSWQGVGTAIEALALYRRDAPARLAIVGFARAGQREHLERIAARLGVLAYVDFHPAATQDQLVALHHAADAVLAPLAPNDRNLVQGCCPLKVLEAMASGTPLVASGLPVVTALARPDIDALIVRPASARAIKDALHRLRVEPRLATRLSIAARQRIEQRFTWEIAERRLRRAYQRFECAAASS